MSGSRKKKISKTSRVNAGRFREHTIEGYSHPSPSIPLPVEGRGKETGLRNAPLILVSPNTEVKGDEFGDTAISLSETYQRAIIQAGGLPMVMTGFADAAVLAECVSRCDGVLFTGGEDINPKYYTKRLSPALRKTVNIEPGERDMREMLLVAEVFRQRKPLFGVCRGHQVVNVALGGSLVVDIASQIPGAIDHRQMSKRSEVVHEARLTEGSLLAKITGKRRLGVNSTHHQAVARVATPCAF